MTIADDDQNPRPQKKLDKSLDAVTALRQAMQQRLAEAQKIKMNSSLKQAESSAPVEAPVSAPTESPIEAPPVAFVETPVETPIAPPVEASAPPPVETPVEAQAELPPPPPEPETKPSNPPPESKEAAPETPVAYPAEWSAIFMRIAERSQKLMLDFIERNRDKPPEFPMVEAAPFAKAFAEMAGRAVNDPDTFVDTQIALWQGYLGIWQTTLARMQGQPVDDLVNPSPFDRRFLSKEWQNNWLLDYLKQIYLLSAQQAQAWIDKESAKLNPKLRSKVEFFTRQMVDATSPSNFWMTNPDVLRATMETGGENLIKGLENLLHDIERGHGGLRISMTDEAAFKVGENIATTPGKVVYQNHLMQLIQYAPMTPTVHRAPLLILPPWINKYYILDLKPKNSFIRYLVEAGYTVFIVSWINPNASHAAISFDDYMMDGAFAAMREVRRVTGEPDINMVGYCIGGTLLSSSLGYLESAPNPPPDLPKVLSATYLVTLVDFSEPGDIGVFIDDEMIHIAEEHMAKLGGYMDGATVSMVFNLLRANDLIWSYVINNYLLGREPAPFDILYWNADSTNLPAAMQSFYLRNMYLENKLVEPNGITLKGVPIDLSRITVPSFLLSTRDDHIAPWRTTYAAVNLYRGPVTFMLASSGHIAGVVNHPAANKYGYATNDARPASPDEWLKNAVEHKGSWWPEWLKWLAPRAGDQVPARAIKDGIEDAPGSYVKVRAV